MRFLNRVERSKVPKTVYLVEEKGFFSTTQQLLVIQDQPALTLCDFRDESSIRNQISWEQLVSVRCSNDTNELMIEYSNDAVGNANDSGVHSGPAKSNASDGSAPNTQSHKSLQRSPIQTLKLNCQMRSQLVCQLSYLIQVKQLRQAALSLQCRYTPAKGLAAASTSVAQLQLYDTAIEVEYEVRQQTTTAEQLVIVDQETQHNFNQSSCYMEEHFEMFERSQSTEHNQGAFSMNDPSPRQSQAAARGQPKDEAFWSPTANHSKEGPRDTQTRISTLLLCNIQKLIQIKNSIIVVTNAQETECIHIHKQDNPSNLVSQIRENFRRECPHLRDLDFYEETYFQNAQSRAQLEAMLQCKLSKLVTFMTAPYKKTLTEDKKTAQRYIPLEKQAIFKMQVEIYNEKFNILKRDQTIVLDQSSLFEFDSFEWTDSIKHLQAEDPHTDERAPEKLFPTNQAKFIDLESVALLNENEKYNLVLYFRNEVRFLIKARSYEDRERLVSALLTLRSFIFDKQKQGNAKHDLLKIKTDGMAEDNEMKIWGYEPLYSDAGHQAKLTLEYEMVMLGRLDVRNKHDIERVIANSHFFQIHQDQHTELNSVLEGLTQVIEQYADLDKNEAQMKQIEQNLYSGKGCQAQTYDLIFNIDETMYTLPNPNLNQVPQFRAMAAAEANSGDEVTMEFGEPAGESADIDISAALEIARVTTQTVMALNVIRSLLNSSAFFEIIPRHNSLIECLTKLLKDKNSTIAILAAYTLRAAMHFNGRNASSMERVEKQKQRWFFNYQMGDDDDDSQVNVPKVLPQITEYLEDFEKCYDFNQKVFPLHITGIYLILGSVLKWKVESTPDEVLREFYAEINKRKSLTLLLDKLSLCHASLIKAGSPSPVDKGASMATLTQFSAKASQLTIGQGMRQRDATMDDASLPGRLEEQFVVQYLFSMILSENLKYITTQQNDKNVRNVTEYLMSYTIQFLWHLQLQELTNLQPQKEVSRTILAHMLQHQHCKELFTDRILPVPLRKQCERYKKDVEQWQMFFTIDYSTSYNSEKKLWNDDMRLELVSKVAKEIRSFKSSKQEAINESGARRSRQQSMNYSSTHRSNSEEASRMNRQPTLDGPIKWNYAEFEVQYDESLKDEYFVGSYYLKKLLKTDTNATSLKAVKDPDVFWNQLQVSFMASTDKRKQYQILMTLCQLYKDKWADIGKIKSLGYWMCLMQKQDYAHCHFLLLQLFHIALCQMEHDNKNYLNKRFVEDTSMQHSSRGEIVKQNMQKFIKEKGFLLLHNCINLVFKELPDTNDDNSYSSKGQPNHDIGFSEEPPHDEDIGSEERIINFTVNKTHKIYFSRNSKNVSMAILSIKIFDLIFTNMQFIDNLPLSSNRSYLIQEHSLATLTQTILLENGDLTREVLIFIEKHLSDHFTVFKMRKTGMIEFLILCLSTKNNFRALRLLKIFQEVCLQFNKKLKLGDELAANDLRMIREDKLKRDKDSKDEGMEEKRRLDYEPSALEDRSVRDKKPEGSAEQKKQHPLLGDSIFLRYLPVPFIKYLYEQDDQSFLEIYRRQEYKHPILIWKKSMRETLEKRIKQNAMTFLDKLREFASRLDSQRNPQKIEIFAKQLTEIVKYKDIEDEVRCGRFYLSVWTSSERDYRLKDEKEEKDLQEKMQTELRQCIYEQNMKNKKKIIVLFKMLHLTLLRFESKRINSLKEIKRILDEICAPKSQDNTDQNYFSSQSTSMTAMESINQQPSISERIQQKFEYNSETRQLLYYGTKIFYEAIKVDSDNKSELLTMNGVDIMRNIINFILSKAKKPPSQPSKTTTEVQPVTISEVNLEDSGVGETDLIQTTANGTQSPTPKQQQQQAEVDVTSIEADTLLLAIKAIGRLIKADTAAFIDTKLDHRVELFRQMTQILNLSVQLSDLLDNRQLESMQADVSSRLQQTSGTQSFLQGKTTRTHIEEARDQSLTMAQAQIYKVSGVKRRKKPQKLLGKNDPKKGDLNRNKDGQHSKDEREDHGRDFDSLRFLDFLNTLKEKRNEQNAEPRKNNPRNNNEESKYKKYVVSTILYIARQIFKMMNYIAYQPQLHPDLIASGLVWQAVRHAYFDLKAYFDITKDLNLFVAVSNKNATKLQDKTLKKILDDSTQSVMLIVSFAQRYHDASTETMQFKNLTKKNEREIMEKFHDSIQRIFTKRMQQELICKFTINNESEMEVAGGKISAQSFLKLFSDAKFESPELIWNSETREELHDVLSKQIIALIDDYADNETRAKTNDRKQGLKPNRYSEIELSTFGKSLGNMFSNVICVFDYKVNERVLRIDEVYITNFIKQQDNKELLSFSDEKQESLEKKKNFAMSIISHLGTMLKESQNESGESPPPLRKDDKKELVMAFQRLVEHFNLNIKERDSFTYCFDTLCSLIKLKLEKGDNNTPEEQSIAKSILDIINHIIKKRLEAQAGDHNEENQHFLFLLGSKDQDFSKEQTKTQPNKSMLMLLRDVLEQQSESSECTQLKQKVINILSDVIKIKDYVLPLFSKQGILVFLLKILFDPVKYPIEVIQSDARLVQPHIRRSATALQEERKGTLSDEDIDVIQGDGERMKPPLRQTLLDIIMKVELEQKQSLEEHRFEEGVVQNFEKTGILKAFLPKNFLREIEHRMETDGDNPALIEKMQQEWLKSFEKDHESVFVLWNAELRQKCYQNIEAQCEKFRNSNSESVDLIKLPQIEDPKLVEEYTVEKIILRVYNKNANVFIDTELSNFIKKLISELEKVHKSLHELRSSSDVTQLVTKPTMDDEDENTENRKKFHYECHKARLLLSALLLSIEQLINDENPNEKVYHNSVQQPALISWRVLPSTFLRDMKVWLQSPVFLEQHIPPEIRITFLQVLYFVVTAKDALQSLKGETLLNFISIMISKIDREIQAESNLHQTPATLPQPESEINSGYSKLEESLVMMIISNVINVEISEAKKDHLPSDAKESRGKANKNDIWSHLVKDNSLTQLMSIAVHRPHCDQEVKYIYTRISQAQRELQIKSDLKKKIDNKNSALEIKSYQTAEYSDAIEKDKRWRPREGQKEKLYIQTSEFIMENFVKSQHSFNLQPLPIISEASFAKYDQELRPNEDVQHHESVSNQSQSISVIEEPNTSLGHQ